jgi:hypothetical protein
MMMMTSYGLLMPSLQVTARGKVFRNTALPGLAAAIVSESFRLCIIIIIIIIIYFFSSSSSLLTLQLCVGLSLHGGNPVEIL